MQIYLPISLEIRLAERGSASSGNRVWKELGENLSACRRNEPEIGCSMWKLHARGCTQREPTGRTTPPTQRDSVKMIKTYTALFLLAAGAIPALASVTVNTPSNNAVVPTQFTLSAVATTCSDQPVSSMGFSLDSSTDTTIVKATSIDALVTSATGAHTLHVKAWGNDGASCVTDVALTVSASATPVAKAASTSEVSSEGVSVSSPANGATVSSPFTLNASATDCSSQSVSAMGYSLDNSSSTAIVKSTSVGASITASAGAHTLHVKSWGTGGASCVANVAITVNSSATTAAVATSSSGVTISSPANGASVTAPLTIAASASTCSSQTVTAIGVGVDNATKTIFTGKSLDTQLSPAAGQHTLYVSAWGSGGAVCNADVVVNVTSSSTSVSSAVPSDATSVSSIQALSTWKGEHDPGTTGSSSGSMALVSSPTLNGNTRRFNTSFSGSGGELYDVTFGDDTSATNFFYDGWVYMTSSSSSIGNLEMDMNQVMPNGQTVIFGFQCDGYSGTWDYTENAGTPTKTDDKWIHSSAACDPRTWGVNAWHHVQISYSRNGSGDVTYKAVWLDGKESGINATVPSAFALGWAPVLLTNFQVDGLGSGSNTVYLDQLTISRW